MVNLLQFADLFLEKCDGKNVCITPGPMSNNLTPLPFTTGEGIWEISNSFLAS